MSRAKKLKESEASKPGRESVKFWLALIKKAKDAKNRKKHCADTKSAYEEYERMQRDGDDSASGVDSGVKRGYPIWWASCKILEAAYYSLTPKIRSRRLYGIEDEMALTMSLIADRFTQFLVDHGNFNETMMATKVEYIQAGRATTQVIYSTDTEVQRMPLQKFESENEDAEPLYYEEYPEDPYDGEVMEDEEGYFYNKTVAKEDTQQIICAPVLYDEVLHTPHAKSNAEITELMFKFSMEKEEAEKRFNTKPDGSPRGLKLPYSGKKEDDTEVESSDDEDSSVCDEYIEGWECWCLKTRKIYWVCEKYKNGFLGVEDDAYKLRKFFPSPKFIIANKHRTSMFCTPVFVYLESTVNQLHTLYYRIFRLIDSIRRRAITFGLSSEVVDALNKMEGEDYISAGQMTDMLSKADISQFIQFVPVKELVDALSETTSIEEHFKQNFYEWFRMPDILRGASDPQETLGAQEMKADVANDSFKYDKQQIIEIARDTAELMLDLGLQVYSPEKIARICGYEYLEAGTPEQPPTPAQPPSPENPEGVPETPGVPAKLGHKERFFDALQKLKDDIERIVRIDFETDSTSFRDDARELQRQQMISDVVLKGLGTISSIEHPENMQIAMKMLLMVLNLMGGSSQSEDLIKSVVADLKKAKETPPPPPPPDYEQMKVQILGQKNEIASARDQMNAENKAREVSVKEMKVNLEGQRQQLEAQLAITEQNLKAAQQQFEQQMAAAKQSSDEQIKSFQALLDKALVGIEQQKVEIEKLRTVASIQESALEEARLAKEEGINAAKAVAEFLASQTAKEQEAPKAQAPAPAPMPNITIVNDSGKKRGWKMVHPDGKETRLEPDMMPDED